MKIDGRGGHNGKSFNTNFFKKWTFNMAYVLGYICADGTIVNSIPSRTCYLKFSSIDKQLIQDIKSVMASDHKIVTHMPTSQIIKGKKYTRSVAYHFKIGSKEIYQDLKHLKIADKKALRIEMPDIPNEYFFDFVRGYLDGDGCLYYKAEKGRLTPRLRTIFVSGCKEFLVQIEKRVSSMLDIRSKKVIFNKNVYRLTYEKRDSHKLLNKVYKNSSKSIYLNRKFSIYQNYLQNEAERFKQYSLDIP